MNTAAHITTDIKQQSFSAGAGNLADYDPLIYPLQVGYTLFVFLIFWPCVYLMNVILETHH